MLIWYVSVGSLRCMWPTFFHQYVYSQFTRNSNKREWAVASFINFESKGWMCIAWGVPNCDNQNPLFGTHNGLHLHQTQPKLDYHFSSHSAGLRHAWNVLFIMQKYTKKLRKLNVYGDQIAVPSFDGIILTISQYWLVCIIASREVGMSDL